MTVAERPSERPCGAWPSPITADVITGAAVALGAPIADGEDIYWSEGRPTEGGRTAIMRRRPDGGVAEVVAPPFDARCRVHEYGGRSYAVRDGVMAFSNFADQRVYRLNARDGADAPTPISADIAGCDLRFGDFDFDPERRRVVCVCEDHRAAAHAGEPANAIVALDLFPDRPGEGATLVDGQDFFAYPRISPDGRRLAWLSWSHPDMPWDATDLWVAEIGDDGGLGMALHVAGGGDESIFQPAWSPHGALHFVSDRSGWWNLYCWDGGAGQALCPRAAEFGAPLWALGARAYDFVGDGRIVCAVVENGRSRLHILDRGALTPLDLDLAACASPSVQRSASGPMVLFSAAPADKPTFNARLDLAGGAPQALKRSADLAFESGLISVAKAVTWPVGRDAEAHGFFYAPANPRCAAPAGELPPLMVRSHGGPTGAASAGFSLAIQFWTSRGFAVLDVNYRGSAGYGRAYRQALDGLWGVADVADCAAGATWLAAQGRVDGARLIIRGGSAGGYTTLSALTFTDVFKAGASLYGVGDLEALARDTHKFESRYLDRLIGPYPQARERYVARSPIHHTERLNCPVIFLQGLDDKVAPANQAEAMVAALRAKGAPVAYIAFEGEGHGFRAARNIKRALEAELLFYGRVFGFEPADDIAPLDISNM